jgi:hypothetical protein
VTHLGERGEREREGDEKGVPLHVELSLLRSNGRKAVATLSTTQSYVQVATTVLVRSRERVRKILRIRTAKQRKDSPVVPRLGIDTITMTFGSSTECP